MADRFDKFSEHARQTLTLAQLEAQRFNHNYIGTEHLLLAITRLPEDAGATEALARLSVPLEKVRESVEFIIGRGDRAVLGEIGLTPRAKRVIELAVDECRRLNSDHIGSKHLLVGLVREGEGIAAGVLESVGVTLERARAAIAGAAGDPGTSASSPASVGRTSFTEQGGQRFDSFSERARRVMSFAQEEALRLSHPYIAPEHLLLGLIGEEEGVAGRVLADLGVRLEPARQMLAQIAPPGVQPVGGELGVSPAAKRVIEAAIVQTRRLNHGYIGTEHLLLGLLQSDDERTVRFIAALGLDPAAAWDATLRLLASAGLARMTRELPAHELARAAPLQTTSVHGQVPPLDSALVMILREQIQAERAGQTERATQLARIAADLRAILQEDQQRGGG